MIHDLLKAFTDNSIIAKAFKESGVDTEFFNYSMLNKETLSKARGYLMELYLKVQELENIRKINVNLINQNKSKDKSKSKDDDKSEDYSEDQMDLDENASKDSKITKTKKKEQSNNGEIKTLKDKTEAII